MIDEIATLEQSQKRMEDIHTENSFTEQKEAGESKMQGSREPRRRKVTSYDKVLRKGCLNE